jgi:hypothetical protein
MTFVFNLKDTVRIIVSGEAGEVIGRAEYLNSNPQYLVRYKSADGRAVEYWWSGDALDLADVMPQIAETAP